MAVPDNRLGAPHPFRLFDLGGYLDVDGRPLGEIRAPPERLAGVPMELRACPYPGSRQNHPHPMNVSALRQMLDVWPAVSELLRGLVQDFATRHRRQALSLVDVWQITFSAAHLPAFQLFRARAPVEDGRISRPVSGAHKTVMGMQALVERLLFQSLMTGEDILAPADAEALWTNAEDLGALVGLEQVCAGPSNRIQEALRWIAQIPASPVPTQQLDEALAPEAQAPFRAFVREGIQLYLASVLFAVQRARALRTLQAARDALGSSAFAARVSEALGRVRAEEERSASAFSQLAEFAVEMPPEVVDQLIARTPELAAEPGEHRLGEALRMDAVPHADWVEALRRCAGSEAVPSEPLEQLASTLAAWVALEQRTLGFVSGVHARMASALGESGAEARLPRSTLTGYFGGTPWDAAQALLGAQAATSLFEPS